MDEKNLDKNQIKIELDLDVDSTADITKYIYGLIPRKQIKIAQITAEEGSLHTTIIITIVNNLPVIYALSKCIWKRLKKNDRKAIKSTPVKFEHPEFEITGKETLDELLSKLNKNPPYDK